MVGYAISNLPRAHTHTQRTEARSSSPTDRVEKSRSFLHAYSGIPNPLWRHARHTHNCAAAHTVTSTRTPDTQSRYTCRRVKQSDSIHYVCTSRTVTISKSFTQSIGFASARTNIRIRCRCLCLCDVCAFSVVSL